MVLDGEDEGDEIEGDEEPPLDGPKSPYPVDLESMPVAIERPSVPREIAPRS
jgi:hypothetical protein